MENTSLTVNQSAPSGARYKLSHRLFRILTAYLLELNLFQSEPSTIDPYKLQTQRISTRVFIVAFLLAFFILLIYSSTNTTIRTITIKKPDLVQYDDLFSLHGSTLSCPCSQISVEYRSIVEINYWLHPICYSGFVTDRWLLHLQAINGELFVDDFRLHGMFFFPALQSFCQLSEDTIKDSLNEFLAQKYISTVLTPRNILHAQMNSSVQQFISTTTNGFTSSLQMIMDTSQINALASGLFTNYYFFFVSGARFLKWYPRVYDDGCVCIWEADQCLSKAAIYQDMNRSQAWYIPGFHRGCFVLEAVRGSHLECLFNEACLSELDVHWESLIPYHATPLDSSQLFRFTSNTSMRSMIDVLMVDEWKSNEMYVYYFDSCHPNECSYEVIGRNNVVGIVTTIIGLIGGLVTILKLIVPNMVSLIRWIKKPRTSSLPDQSIMVQLKNLPYTTFRYLANLNLFPSKSTTADVYDLQTGRFSTKIFIVILIFAFSILLIYTSAVKIFTRFTIKSPTVEQFDELALQYGSILSCPCSQISSDYKTFITIDHFSHEICNSVYITDEWFAYMTPIEENVLLEDFRLLASKFFRGIQTICKLADDHLKNNLIQFFSNNYISTSATPEKIFASQNEGVIKQFISSTTNRFSWSLQLIRSTNQYNALLSALFTNYALYVTRVPGYVYLAVYGYENCTCAYTSACFSKATIYPDGSRTNTWSLPGFYVGCFILESLMHSRLECFYNQTCLQELYLILNSSTPVHATALNSSKTSHFTSNTAIESIFNALMVDEWSWSIQYENYYNVCRPVHCTYTMTDRRNIILIITTMISLFGGLVTTLKLIVPRLVGLIRWKLKPRPRTLTVQTPKERLLNLIQFLRHYLVNLNLFPSYPPSNDRYQLRAELVSTRVFIVIFTLSIIILVYTSAIPNTQIFTISKPDYDKYKDLFSQHSSTLRCPCSRITTNYETFIDVTYSFHPVCQSMYVTDEWIRYIGGDQTMLWTDDFRLLGIYQFQALQSICQLVADFFVDQLKQYQSRLYINTELVFKDVFESQAHANIEQFIATISTIFKLSLRTIRDINQANFILSAIMNNAGLNIAADSPLVHSYPKIYKTICSCVMKVDCVDRLAIHDRSRTSMWYVPGFYQGCSNFESLRQSNLECFYDQTCLDTLHLQLTSDIMMDFLILDSSSLVRFFPNSSVGEIIDDLMIDGWQPTVHHEKYYDSCQPVECSYEIIERDNFIVLLTKLIGVAGGLLTALKIVVPRTVKISFKLWQRRRAHRIQSTINPTISSIDIVPRTTTEYDN